jgi:hypothetical protein
LGYDVLVGESFLVTLQGYFMKLFLFFYC